MKLKQRVINQLEQLATNGPEPLDAVIQKSPEPGLIVGIPSENGIGASMSLADYDRYSVTLRHLAVYNKQLTLKADETEQYLHRCAAEITQRLIYLEEPLALLELDTTAGVAQLRSSPPEQGPNRSIYWEVTVRAKPYPQAKLTRLQWTAGRRDRLSLTYPATFATLGRLSEDLATGLAIIAEAQ